MRENHANTEPTLDAVLSRLGSRAFLHYTIDLSRSPFGRGGFEILWSLNQRVESTHFAGYGAARTEFYRRIKRLQKEGYRVVAACDEVMRQLHSDTIGALKLRKPARVARAALSLAKPQSVAQFVPAGRRVHIVFDRCAGEPYAIDATGTRVELSKELGSWFVDLSPADHALEIFEGVMTGGKIALIDVCYHNCTDYRRRRASERLDILRTLSERSPSPWVEMAPTACGAECRELVFAHAATHDGKVALSVPDRDRPSSAADEHWVEFSCRQQAQARVARRLAADRIDVEMRLSTGRWTRVGEAVCSRRSPMSPGDIVTIEYVGVALMNAQVIGARVLEQPAGHDVGSCGINQLL